MSFVADISSILTLAVLGSIAVLAYLSNRKDDAVSESCKKTIKSCKETIEMYKKVYKKHKQTITSLQHSVKEAQDAIKRERQVRKIAAWHVRQSIQHRNYDHAVMLLDKVLEAKQPDPTDFIDSDTVDSSVIGNN